MAQQPEQKPRAALSSKILGLQFMKRAKEKKELEQSQAVKKEDEEERQGAASEHDQEAAGTSGGCKIIYEKSIPRTGTMGRFSFGSASKKGGAATAPSAGAGPHAASAVASSKGPAKQEEETVSAADMAKTLARAPAGGASQENGKRKKQRMK